MTTGCGEHLSRGYLYCLFQETGDHDIRWISFSTNKDGSRLQFFLLAFTQGIVPSEKVFLKLRRILRASSMAIDAFTVVQLSQQSGSKQTQRLTVFLHFPCTKRSLISNIYLYSSRAVTIFSIGRDRKKVKTYSCCHSTQALLSAKRMLELDWLIS